MKVAQLSEAAQRFLIEPEKPYHILELKATIHAAGDYVFLIKKDKLLKKKDKMKKALDI
ncbi:hypothetical protein D3C87_719960 [compost metagenome]